MFKVNSEYYYNNLREAFLHARPTGLFIISEPQNQENDEFYLDQKRRSTDINTQKAVKDSVG